MSLIFHAIGFLFLVRTREQQTRAVFFPQRIASHYKMVRVKAILHLAERIQGIEFLSW